MKIAARCLTALAVLAFATPALPCGDKAMKTTTASAEKAKSTTVAKATAKKGAASTKAAPEAKPTSAPN